MKKILENKRKAIGIIAIIVGLALIITGTSYAYFTATATSNEQVVESGTLRLTYETGQDINALSIIPTEESSASIHQFTVENTGSLDTDYNISLIDINLSKEGTPTFSSNLKWALYSTNENYSEESLVKSGDFSSLSGYVSGDDTLVIKTNQNLSSGAKQSYVFKVWLQEINIPQNEDQNLSLTMKIQVDTLERQEAVSRQSVMRTREGQDSTETFYQYKDSITEVVFQNKMNSIDTDISWDISTDGNGNCMAYLVPNAEDSGSTYTLYIQGNDEIFLENGTNFFYGFNKLEEIERLNYLNTSAVTDMESMFSNCRSLNSIDLSNFDTSQVRNMNYMFLSCSTLENLDLSSFNTVQVTSMISMFGDCTNLRNIELSSLNTEKVSNMQMMFYGCSNLITLDLSSFSTSETTNMVGMFFNCTNLQTLDLSSFDTSKVTKMGSMFQGCNNLFNLDFSKAIFNNVTDYNGMFASVPSTIQVIVKDSTAQAWIQDKLGSGVGTVTIAPTA